MSVVYRREARALRAFEVEGGNPAVVTTVVNERERDALQAINPRGRVEVVPSGVDLQAFRNPDPPQPSASVVFCGVFSYEPNELGAIWLAQSVWPLVRRPRPDAALTLVGMGPSKRVRDLSVDPWIVVTGTVDDVRPYLWGAAVSAAPLQIARGLQNKVLEAVAAGLPCVTTPQGVEGLPASLPPACLVAASAEDFADAIVRVLSQTPLERRARAQTARFEHLNWESELEPMVPLLESAALSQREPANHR